MYNDTQKRGENHMTRNVLSFSEGHFEAILLGKKKMTLRLYRSEAHDFKKGQVVYGKFPEGFSLMLEVTEDTACFKAEDLSDEVAREDGYKNARYAVHGLKKFYGGRMRNDTALACIRFKIAEIYSEPVLKITDPA